MPEIAPTLSRRLSQEIQEAASELHVKMKVEKKEEIAMFSENVNRMYF